MGKRRVILANGSRLLHDMLNRILLKADQIKIVAEVSNPELLPDAIRQFDAEWVIFSIPIGGKLPDWVDTCLVEYPSVRFLAVTTDGSIVKMKWLQQHEESLSDLSLDGLIHILEEKSA